MASVTPRQVVPAQRRKLTRDDITAAAVGLIERDGLETLTMRSLAVELGCAPMSLYTHVRSREDLVDAIVGRLISELDTRRVPGETWQQGVRRALESYRDLAVRTPRSFELLALAPYDSSPVAEHLNGFAENLAEGGLSVEQARQVLAITDAYATGFLVVWARGAGGRDPSAEEPGLSSLRSMEVFDKGLDALIAGLGTIL